MSKNNEMSKYATFWGVRYARRGVKVLNVVWRCGATVANAKEFKRIYEAENNVRLTFIDNDSFVIAA